MSTACTPADAPVSAPTTVAKVQEVAPGQLVFPLERLVPVSDTFGAPRSGGRTHEGQDLMAPKMTKLVAVVDGTIAQIKHTNSGLSGNQVRLRGDDGYDYYYIHLNNDTPGTDDGKNRFDQAFADGLRVGQRVSAGEFIGYLGDSGNAEDTAPHLHFEARKRDGGIENPFAALKAAPVKVLDTSKTRPFGTLDAVDIATKGTVKVSGWALAATGNAVVPYSVFIDGNPASVGLANTSRPDVGARYQRDAAHGFAQTVTGVAAGRREVCVVLYNPAERGGGGGRTNCAQVTVR